jgi:Holliday junction resolvasome RuvABC endonuclease subunit
VDWALHALPEAHETEWVRASSLSNGIIGTLSEWVDAYKIDTLHVGIEVPFYNRNPRTFRLQVRLLQGLEEGLTVVVGSEVPDLYLTEVHPSTAKRRLTGDKGADKKAMIAASPWARADMKYDYLHTLADAYAIALCADACEHSASSLIYTPWTMVEEKGARHV